MWRRVDLITRLITGYWLACGCSAEPAQPSSRASTQAAAASGAPSEMAPPAAGASAPPQEMPRQQPTAAPPGVPLIAAPTPAAASGASACEIVQLVAEPQVPDVMIVLDRSGSMERGGRWRPSVAALRKITLQLQARIRFGLTLFPSDSGATASNDAGPEFVLSSEEACVPGQVVVPVAEMNAAPIAMKLDATRPNGGTPTAQTLLQLVDGYASMEAGPDAKQHAKFVLLVTDGAPTCPNGMGRGDQPNKPDVDLTNQVVETLSAHRVHTFVIGYDTATPGNEALAQALDGFAQRGGTGDQKHRPVEDEASLTAALESVTGSIASCSFKLDKPPARPDYVLVTLDGNQLNLNDANGWQLIGDHTVEIVGSACTTFKSGAHLLNAVVQCKVVTPS